MIVLDTDVLSAVMRAEKEPRVIAWLDHQPRELLYTTAVTLHEILNGLEEMPLGAKKAKMHNSLEILLAGPLNKRIVPVDEASARLSSRLYGERRRGGRTVGLADTLIAGIAISRGATLATGNVRDFFDLQVPVINPWEAA
ncbi:MAG TPA: type II toxin-antitoxin system VapC family toxin [Rhizomicrobium sp.]|nr:type II toxin-antitoxin system VapC family toxin [Rhizomicrobium sp.]